MSWSICWRFAGIGADKHPLDSQCKPLSVELPGTLLAGAPAPVGQLSQRARLSSSRSSPAVLASLCALVTRAPLSLPAAQEMAWNGFVLATCCVVLFALVQCKQMGCWSLGVARCGAG